jgi:hypothetical protein
LSRLAANTKAADSVMTTKEDSYMVALMKILICGCTSVLMMKISKPAGLGVDVVLSSIVEASVEHMVPEIEVGNGSR